MVKCKVSGTDNKCYEFGEGKDGIMLKWSELLSIPKMGNNLVEYNIILQGL